MAGSRYTVLCKVEALYPFEGEDPTSIRFEPGDLILVVSKHESGWWSGRRVEDINSKPGWFPKDYVRIIENYDVETYDAFDSKVEMQDSDLPSPWIVQMTEDGTGQYYFNRITGEMRTSPPGVDDMEDYELESVLPTDHDALSWSDNDQENEEEEPESGFVPKKLPMPWAKYILPPEYEHMLIQGNSSNKAGNNENVNWPDSPAAHIQYPLLTWEIISTCIAITIENLNLALRHFQRAFYGPCVTAVANSIRLMLMASGMTEQDAVGNNYSDLRSELRSVIACLGKTTLNAQMLERQEEEQKPEYERQLAEDARDLLVAVRGFVSTCKTIPVHLRPFEPSLDAFPSPTMNEPGTPIAEMPSNHTRSSDDIDKMAMMLSPPLSPPAPFVPRYRERRENSTASNYTAVSAKSSSTTATSVSSKSDGDMDEELDLAELVEAAQNCGQDLKKSVEAMLTCLQDPKHQRIRTALASQMFSRLDHLSKRAGQLLLIAQRICFDKETESWIMQSKQNLLTGFGILFYKLQVLTDEHTPISDAVYDIVSVVKALQKPIETVVQCIDRVPLEPKSQQQQQSTSKTDESPVSTKVNGSEQENASLSKPDPVRRASSCDSKPHYLGYDYDPSDIVFTAEGHVKGGTLPALVERLTQHDQPDMNFINTFLLTFRSFCTSAKLCELLEERFQLKPPSGLSDSEHEQWTEQKLKLVRLRVFNVLKHWLEQYYNDEEDKVILNRLQQFTNEHLRPSMELAAKQLEKLIRNRQGDDPSADVRRMISTVRNVYEPILPRNSKKFRLLDVHPLELARQLSLMDFQLYSAIQPSECLHKAWSSPDKSQGPHIRASIEYSNQVTLWVSDAILSQTDVKKRCQVIKYWVQVAEKCQQLNNFNTLMAILSAFDNSAVGRLNRTWEIVGARSMQALASLKRLLGAQRNFVEYRSLIHSVNPPCIPFLGIYLQDLTFIEDGNPDLLKHSAATGKNLINFGKLAKTGEVIREIQQYQSIPYPYQSVDVLQTFIKANLQSARDEDCLYTESLRLEPRECQEQKVTRLLMESGFI